MKILAFMGSPRKNGNTARLLNCIKEALSETDEMEIVSLTDFKINGCTGCSFCQNDMEHYRCIQQDDVNMLLNKIINADCVLYGTPLYGHNYSGQLKVFLDRHIPLFKFVSGKDKAVNEMKIVSAIEKKPAALVVSCQGPAEYNTELIQSLFEKFCESSLAQCIGKYVFPFCSTDAGLSEYNEETIQAIVRDISTSFHSVS